MRSLVAVVVPTINFILLSGVGMDLTAADFARVRRQRALVLAGLIVPGIALPPIALLLLALFEARPELATGVLLIAACPIGGISNAYSYLARASTALSVTLTALSCLFASVTIPLISRGLELVVGRPLDFTAPFPLLFAQLTLMLGLPVALGMWIRNRWPDFATRHRRELQRLAFIGLGVLLVGIILDNPAAFVGGLGTAVPLAAVFIVLSFGAGWLTAALLTHDDRDRFTVAAEFGSRNLGVALAVAVILLGRVEFGRFATIYALVEIPIMLAAVIAFRKYIAGRETTRSGRKALQRN